jgi:transcriptional regulator with XRE-family HTH domain
MPDRKFREAIAIAIRGLRAERRWTQRELCRQTDLSPAYLSEIESGQKDASADVLMRLATAFGHSMDEFMWVVLLAMMTGEVPNVARRDSAMKMLRHTLESDPQSRAELEDFIRFQQWKRSTRKPAKKTDTDDAPVSDGEPGSIEPDFTEDL